MEKVNYRETLVWLSELFDGKVILTAKDISEVFKIDPRTVRKLYITKDNKMIEITRLASLMCLSSAEIRQSYFR